MRRLIILACLALCMICGGSWAGEVHLQISQGTDDAEEDIYAVSNANQPLWACCVCSAHSDTCWMVAAGNIYRNVTVPQGATIDSAFWSIYSYGAPYNNVACTLYCELTDSCETYPEGSYPYISARTYTTEKYFWEQASISGSSFTRSPNIANIIQPVVNQSGWKSGNALGLKAVPGKSSSTWYCTLEYQAWELDAGGHIWGSKLDIYYAEAAPPSAQKYLPFIRR